jgi:hypothetical protein
MYKQPISCRDNHKHDVKYSKLNEGECNVGIECVEARLERAVYSLPFWCAVFRRQRANSNVRLESSSLHETMNYTMRKSTHMHHSVQLGSSCPLHWVHLVQL